jgi:hypothetical protein
VASADILTILRELKRLLTDARHPGQAEIIDQLIKLHPIDVTNV